MAVKHSAEVTVYDVSDAYSVTLTNEAATFKATSDTQMGTAGTATTKPQAFMGSDAVACSVTAADCTRSDSTNVTVSVNSSGDNATWPLLTITVGANATSGGTVTIPVVIGSGTNAVTVEKVFSYSIALKGTAGTSVSVSSVKYTTSTTETQPADSAFTDTTVPTVAEGSWLWTMVTFSNGTKAYSKSKQGTSGTNGTNGTNGTSYYTHVRYSASSDGSSMVATPTSSTIYIGVYTGTSSSAPTTPSSYTWSRYKGEDGDNPYTLSLTSDNGTVLKNNTGQTTLTAHVYQAGAELSTMPSGHSVKWYVDGTLTETDNSLPATFTRTAAQIANKAVVKAQLEG